MSAVSTDGVTPSGNSANLHGSWFAFTGVLDATVWFQYGIGDLTDETSHQVTGGSANGTYTHTVSTAFDRNYQFKAKGDDDFQNLGGSTNGFLSFAEAPTAGTPVASAVTSNSATISDTFDAKCVESTFSVVMQYRQFGSPTWLTAGLEVTSGGNISRDITGLTGSTTYEIRLLGNRTTANIPSWTSVTVTFTTSADSPTVTTGSASVVTSTTAILNGSVDPNGISVRVRFGYGIADGGSNPNAWNFLTGYQSFSGDGDQTFEASVVSLIASTPYFFRAFVEWPSPTFANGASGSTATFTTAGNPLADAAAEDHVFCEFYEGHYGVQSDLYFSLNSPAATSSDRLVTTAPGTLLAVGDIKLIKDGAASANVTNSVSQPNASQPTYKLTLTAAEMQAELAIVQIVDQNGPAFRDKLIFIRTKRRIGQDIVNASQIGGSASALILQPSSGGYALQLLDSAGTNLGKMQGMLDHMSQRTGTAQAGGAATVTLDSGASATNSYYNDDIIMIVGGTGAGQARVITGYDGTTKIATVNSNWSTNPDSTSRFVIIPGPRSLSASIPELTAIPSATDTAAKKLQFCFQRFAFKVTQTATVQTLYNSSGVSLGTRSVSDDGTTQTIAKVT